MKGTVNSVSHNLYKDSIYLTVVFPRGNALYAEVGEAYRAVAALKEELC